MTRKLFRWLPFAFALMVLACGPATRLAEVDPTLEKLEEERQKDLALRTFAENEKHLLAVAYPLLAAAVPLCGERIGQTVGFRLRSLYSFPKKERAAAARALGVDREWRVSFVGYESPAWSAGIREGDVVEEVNGKAVPKGEDSPEEIAELFASAFEEGEARIDILRDGRRYLAPAKPHSVCDNGVHLQLGDEINALATGEEVFVTVGTMRFMESDSELATFVAHEIAHNAMGHIDKGVTNAAIGSVFDTLLGVVGIYSAGLFEDIGRGAFSQSFEAEADYVGLYIMARAGFDLGPAPNLWRRLAADDPRGIRADFRSTHPSTAERFLALDETLREIEAKRARGLPLLPETRD